jgi:hypothetical protein
MAQQGEVFCLRTEALDKGLVAQQLGSERFDRNHAIEYRIACGINLPNATLTEQLLDFKLPNPAHLAHR